MENIFKIDIYQNEDQQFLFHMTIQNLQGKTFNLSQLFHSCWIRNNISGYRKKFPDPLHWFDVTYFSAKLVNFSYTVGRNAINIFTKFGKLWGEIFHFGGVVALAFRLPIPGSNLRPGPPRRAVCERL